VLWTPDTYKSADYTMAAHVSMQTKGYSSCGRINVRVDGDGLFSWLSDVHGVGMASRAAIGFVKMCFMGGIFI
jgi:hypothetical protein